MMPNIPVPPGVDPAVDFLSMKNLSHPERPMIVVVPISLNTPEMFENVAAEVREAIGDVPVSVVTYQLEQGDDDGG